MHVVRSLDPASGGPPVVAIKLAVAQAAEGHRVRLLAYRVPRAESDVKTMLAELPQRGQVEVQYIPPETLVEKLTGRDAARVSRALMGETDVVHIHGVWDPMLQRVAATARSTGTPYVVTPHGMLDPWSLKQKWWKKRLALWVSVRRMLNEASYLHLLNRDERELIEPLGLTARSVLIPNGVFEEEITGLPARGTFRAAYPSLGEDPYVLFLSRLHFKKGLDYLAEGFAGVAGRFGNLRLVVAGPDGGERANFEKRIAAAGLTSRVEVVGPIYGKMKAAALVDATVFCLPSRQEGFSMAITEALGSGCPCVVTKACHYPEVEESGAGYCVELDGGAVAEGLAKVLGDEGARERMGAAGRELVRTRFTWPVIARMAVEGYRGRGS